METKFKVSDKVNVIKDGCNASEFTLKFNIDPCGVYSLKSWYNTEFTVLGGKVKTGFEEYGNKYCYPIGINNILIGFVYQRGLKLKEATEL